jgi:hypothetical protein
VYRPEDTFFDFGFLFGRFSIIHFIIWLRAILLAHGRETSVHPTIPSGRKKIYVSDYSTHFAPQVLGCRRRLQSAMTFWNLIE